MLKRLTKAFEESVTKIDLFFPTKNEPAE